MYYFEYNYANIFNKKKDYMILGKSMLFGLFINHILLLILGVLAYYDFNKYFTYFIYYFLQMIFGF